MGITFSSLHVYSNEQINDCLVEFKAFSAGWQTCVTDLSEIDVLKLSKLPKTISKKIQAPVLFYNIIDSDSIYFEFYQNGRIISKYSDDGFSPNKGLYQIPEMIGYGDGFKKMLSSILSCGDAETKTAMLEEYFGVCLLPFKDILHDRSLLSRTRNDRLYKEFIEGEKLLMGTKAPITAELIDKRHGKLFWDYSMICTVKKYYYLFGYDDLFSSEDELMPVCFSDGALIDISIEEFEKDRIKLEDYYKEVNSQYDTSYKINKATITFKDNVPENFVGKTLTLPRGYYPFGFYSSKLFVLYDGKSHIAIIDESMKIIAKIAVKGELADIRDGYILTTSGDSFCGYCYEPNAMIRIYKLTEK